MTGCHEQVQSALVTLRAIVIWKLQQLSLASHSNELDMDGLRNYEQIVQHSNTRVLIAAEKMQLGCVLSIASPFHFHLPVFLLTHLTPKIIPKSTTPTWFNWICYHHNNRNCYKWLTDCIFSLPWSVPKSEALSQFGCSNRSVIVIKCEPNVGWSAMERKCFLGFCFTWNSSKSHSR